MSLAIAPSFLTSEGLAAHPTLKHGFFGRKGGASRGNYDSLNLGVGSEDYLDCVTENRARVAKALGANILVSAYQFHSADVVEIFQGHDPSHRPKADGMLTRAKGVALCILTADCVPVLFADVQAGIIGAAHAGWRGAFGGVCEATLDKMLDLGAKPDAIQAAIGPAIRQQNYQVDMPFHEEILTQDPWAGTFFQPDGSAHFRFDLCGYVAQRMVRWGLTPAQIEDVAVDVFAHPEDYFSNRYRLTQNQPDYGRNGSVIMISEGR